MIDTTTVSLSRMLADDRLTIAGWLGPVHMAALMTISLRRRMPAVVVRPLKVSRRYMLSLVAVTERAAAMIAKQEHETCPTR